MSQRICEWILIILKVGLLFPERQTFRSVKSTRWPLAHCSSVHCTLQKPRWLTTHGQWTAAWTTGAVKRSWCRPGRTEKKSVKTKCQLQPLRNRQVPKNVKKLKQRSTVAVAVATIDSLGVAGKVITPTRSCKLNRGLLKISTSPGTAEAK